MGGGEGMRNNWREGYYYIGEGNVKLLEMTREWKWMEQEERKWNREVTELKAGKA